MSEINFIEFYEYESKARKIVTEFHSLMVCADCDKKLVELHLANEDTTVVNRIIAKCTCGGSSFVTRIAGRVYFVPHDGLECDTTVEDDIITLNMRQI